MSGHGHRAGALLERRTTLPPELASAGAARRLLRDVLSGAGREDWLDAGELAISEIVTNAALHAHTAIDVRVALRDEELRVEVRDHNPLMPVQRDYDEEATTGRGMALVAAITSECGVRSLGDDGKVTWFRVAAEPERAVEDVLAAWELEADPATEQHARTEEGRVPVVLAPMPATLWLAARQHHDAILRELVLYLAEHDDVSADLVRADRARGHVSSTLAQVLDAMKATGQPGAPGAPVQGTWPPQATDLTLVVSVPADAGPDFAVLRDVLDTAERLAVDGRLFVRPGLPEIVDVRNWVCEQVIAQLAGEAPQRWAGAAQPRFETEVRSRADADELPWDLERVLGSDRSVVAADDANRIVAVSRPLADILGWEPAQLLGRRVVTIIPHALREAHVAGFSRHLSTGETHILGVPVELPALRADGTEVLCRLLVERGPEGTGKALYLAWLDPVHR